MTISVDNVKTFPSLGLYTVTYAIANTQLSMEVYTYYRYRVRRKE